MKKILSLLTLVFLMTQLSAQSELIISEYVEGWSNNKALELFNPTDKNIDLSEFRLIRYSNGTDVPPAEDTWTVSLPEYILKPYNSYVIVLDQRDPNGTGQDAPVWSQLTQRADVFLCPVYEVSEVMYFNGDDAIVLEKDDGDNFVKHDIFGRWGAPVPADAQFIGSTKKDGAWTNVSPYFTGEGFAITAEHTMFRKSNVTTGVTANPSIFNPLEQYDTLTANTFDHLGWHKFDNAPANETPVITNEALIFGVSPTAVNGASIGSILATDNESDNLKYYMEEGNFIYIEDVRYEPFALNKSTGEITLVDQTGLAPELKDTFYVDINVTDGYSQVGPITAMIIVTDNLNVKVKTNEISHLQLYPNPVTSNQLQIKDVKSIKEVNISGLLGQSVYNEKFSTPVVQKTLEFKDSMNGIYLINIRYSDGTDITRKILIK
jgi:Lamin Tail Domain/Secretion system C-terminal sorting domain